MNQIINNSEIPNINKYPKEERELKKLLSEQFNIDFSNSDIENKFQAAIYGEGTEIKKMIIQKNNSYYLNLEESSSLCSFLSFLQIDNTLKIKGKNTSVLNFNNSLFEIKNIVIYDRIGLSSMDVVLTGNRIALFLECKYKEYLKNSNKSSRSVSIKQSKRDKNPNHNYFYWYKKLFPEIIDGNAFGQNNKDCHKITSNICWYVEGEQIILAAKKGYKIYVHGIKQMISHFIGLINFVDERYYKDSKFTKDQFDKIYLAENLFDFEQNKPYLEKSEMFRNYNETYGELVTILQQKDNRIIFLLNGYNEKLNVFTYQDIFSNNSISNNVRAFYKY